MRVFVISFGVAEKSMEIKEKITVRELITLLIEQPMHHEIILKKDGERIRDVNIVLVEPKGLGALFG